MPFEEIYFAITLIALIIAAYTDLKSRIVPDKLTYGAIILAVALKSAESYMGKSPDPILMSLAGGVAAFAAAYLLYKLGVWAGGDVKLITAIGFLNPFNYSVIGKALRLTVFPFTAINLPIFPVSIIT